jgi:hypothetical protein
MGLTYQDGASSAAKAALPAAPIAPAKVIAKTRFIPFVLHDVAITQQLDGTREGPWVAINCLQLSAGA